MPKKKSIVKTSITGTNHVDFLGIQEEHFSSYEHSKVVIQSAPYEHTSSYISGSVNGPSEIINASHFVEYYDEELGIETYRNCGISTLMPINFREMVDEDAINLIAQNTSKHINNNKFVVSIGAEHTVTYGFYKAFNAAYKDLSVLQIDAHADLRSSYMGNKYSHASVMARINESKPVICQVGIRALCKEEAELITQSDNINTWFAHDIRSTTEWNRPVMEMLTENVYVTIDADGFDPSVIPSVGTPEPNGLYWQEVLDLLKPIFMTRNVVGFDVVECAPKKGEVQSPYNLAKLIYRLIGYRCLNSRYPLT